MDDISFKSYVKFCNKADFINKTSVIDKKHFVDFPWRIKDAVQGRSAYTKDVYDCTVLGITDGLKVLLLHLCANDTSNWNKKRIINMIKEKFDLASGYVQGFVLGSKPNTEGSPYSSNFFDYIKSVPEMLKIPYSSFKGGNYSNDVAYIGDDDTWLVSNELMDNGVFQKMQPEDKAGFVFDEVKLSEKDELYIEWAC